MKNLCGARNGEENWRAVLAAGRQTVGIKEEKRKAKELVGGIVYVMRGGESSAASSPMVPCLWVENACSTR